MKKLQACFAAVCALLFFVSLCLPAHAGQRITGCGFVDDDECFAEGQTTGDLWQGQHFAPGTTNLTYSIDFKELEAYLQVNRPDTTFGAEKARIESLAQQGFNRWNPVFSTTEVSSGGTIQIKFISFIEPARVPAQPGATPQEPESTAPTEETPTAAETLPAPTPPSATPSSTEPYATEDPMTTPDSTEKTETEASETATAAATHSSPAEALPSQTEPDTQTAAETAAQADQTETAAPLQWEESAAPSGGAAGKPDKIPETEAMPSTAEAPASTALDKGEAAQPATIYPLPEGEPVEIQPDPSGPSFSIAPSPTGERIPIGAEPLESTPAEAQGEAAASGEPDSGNMAIMETGWGGYDQDTGHVSTIIITVSMETVFGDTTDPGSLGPMSDRDVMLTFAHELGHGCGLKHQSDPYSIMYENTDDRSDITSEDLARMKIMFHQTDHSRAAFEFTDEGDGSHTKYCTLHQIQTTKQHVEDNYLFNTPITAAVHSVDCICGAHVHNAPHTIIGGNLTPNSSTEHTYQCEDCGTFAEPHTMEAIPGRQNDLRCTVCQYVFHPSWAYTSAVTPTAAEHTLACADGCGATKTEAHSYANDWVISSTDMEYHEETCRVCHHANSKHTVKHDFIRVESYTDTRHALLCLTCRGNYSMPHQEVVNSSQAALAQVIQSVTEKETIADGTLIIPDYSGHANADNPGENHSALPANQGAIETDPGDASLIIHWDDFLSQADESTVAAVSANLNTHTVSCRTCAWTTSRPHELQITGSASGHTLVCTTPGCGLNVTVNHTFSAPSYSSTTQHQQTCTVCGQVTKANHTITSTRPLTEAGQEGYHENYCATCGGRWNEAHTYGSYTDSSASVHVRTCTKCGKENYQAHSWGSYSSTGSTQHKRTCTVSTCGRTQTSNHSWSGYSYLSATYHRRTCSACSASQNASHSISSVTSVDGTNHQNYCATCNGYWNQAHTLTVLTPYGNATKHLAGCTKCNYNIGQNHTFDAWVNYSSSLHRHQCTGCKEYHTASHGSYGSWASYSSSQHRRKCGSCSYYQYGNHGSYGSWTNYSSSQHRRKCGSCAYYQYGNHSYGSNSYYSSTQHRKKCTSCPRYVYANHSYQYSGGYLHCSGCGHEKPYA